MVFMLSDELRFGGPNEILRSNFRAETKRSLARSFVRPPMRRTALSLLLLLASCEAFVVPATVLAPSRRPTLRVRCAEEPAEATAATAEPAEAVTASASLADKMSSWEATDEERKAATLGGVIPKPSKPGKMDGFDLGMVVSGVVLTPLAIGVLTFPFWISKFAADLPAVDVTQ